MSTVVREAISIKNSQGTTADGPWPSMPYGTTIQYGAAATVAHANTPKMLSLDAMDRVFPSSTTTGAGGQTVQVARP
jgi:hypothetical protein